MTDRKQTVFFDLDDTLIHCNKYFIGVLDRFVRQIKAWFPEVSNKEIRDLQLEFDLAGIKKQGLVKERFPHSLAEVYDHFAKRSGREWLSLEREQLIELGFQVYEQEYEPYPDMAETLQRLRDDGHKLKLFTGGDPVIQMAKVDQLNLKRFFGEQIYVAKHKNTEAFEGVLRRTGSIPEYTWMVGNSARTDMIPALEAGAHAIFIPNDTEWVYNQVDINVPPSGAFIQLEELKEVPEAIRDYLAGAN